VCVLRLDNGRVAFSETFLNKWKAFNLPLISARPLIEFSWPRQRTGTNFTFFWQLSSRFNCAQFQFQPVDQLVGGTPSGWRNFRPYTVSASSRDLASLLKTATSGRESAEIFMHVRSSQLFGCTPLSWH